MKGLLTKDLLILFNQKQTMLIIVMCALIMGVVFDANTVVIYLGMLSGLLALGTISYDEFDNGYCFLFTLPVSRKTYVTEKYLFCVVWTLLSLAVGTAAGMIMLKFGVKGSAEDIMLSLLMFLSMLLMIFAIMIPLRLKYGSEKGRIVLYVIFGVLAGIAFLLRMFVGDEVPAFIAKLDTLDPAGIGMMMLGVMAVLLVISYFISVRIMEKKEF